MSIRERQLLCDFTYMWNLKQQQQQNKKIQKKQQQQQQQALRYSEEIGSCQGRKVKK